MLILTISIYSLRTPRSSYRYWPTPYTTNLQQEFVSIDMPIGQHLVHLSREIKTHHYSQFHHTTPKSLAQHLPDELILAILTHLSCDGLLAQHSCPAFRISELSRLYWVEDAAPCQQALYSAALLCRSWHPIGTELLYRAPFLSTKRSVHLLLRTLTASTYLTRFVRNLYVPLATHRSPLDWLRTCLHFKSASCVEISQVRDIVAQLSQNSSLLHMLTLKHVVPSGHISTIPLSSVPIPPNLEHLCIHGTSFDSHTHPQFCLLPSHNDHIVLGSLKSLCLRGMYILPTVQLPRMPLVQRVTLVQNHYFQSMADILDGPSLLKNADFPSLKALEIYSHALPFTTSAAAMPSLSYVLDVAAVQNLEEFTMAQTAGHLSESLQVISSAFVPEDARLKSLTIGLVGLVDCASLERWLIPRSLDQLTFLLSIAPVYSEKHVAAQSLSRDMSRSVYGTESKRPLTSIRRCLQNNAQAAGIRQMTLVVSPLDDVSSSEVEQLGRYCSTHGINLVVVSQGIHTLKYLQ
jgi:hypothetical protein